MRLVSEVTEPVQCTRKVFPTLWLHVTTNTSAAYYTTGPALFLTTDSLFT
jgi:hypothetical protein